MANDPRKDSETKTAAAGDLEPLFRPFTLGAHTLPNRFVMAPHSLNFSSEANGNLVTPRHIEYHRARARAGVALILTEGIRVHPATHRPLGLIGYRDEAIEGLSRLTEAVHEHGTRIYAQILHTGRHDGSDQTGWWAPTPTPWAPGAPVPHQMNGDDLETLVECFAATALRMRRAGFDGVEVHLGHGHLLQQFLSPVSNRRTDAYGGSLGNRMRLARKVLEAVVDSVGDAIGVGIRLSADEFLPGGLNLDDMLEVVGRLVVEYPLSYLHVSHSAYVGDYTVTTQIADMSFEPATFRQHASAFKQAFTDIPIIAVGRMDALDVAARMVSAGESDLIAMARQFIAEPRLVEKARENALNEIRPCIHCNQACVGHLESVKPITCIVNPTSGHENRFERLRSAPMPPPQRVLVVGGGAAGLEAAAAAAGRGHEVTLVERDDRPGGLLRHVGALPAREEFERLVEFLQQAALRAGAEVRLGQEVAASDIVAGSWDTVVLATGSRAVGQMLDDGTEALSVVDAIQDGDSLGQGAVAVYDEDGGWGASALAELLARRGRRVHLLSPIPSLAWNVTTYSRLALLARLGECGVSLHPMRRPRRLEDDGLVTEEVYGGNEASIPGIATVVYSGPRRAEDALLAQLMAGGFTGDVHVVGDAYAPRTVLEATTEGRFAGSAIASADRLALDGLAVREPYRATPTKALTGSTETNQPD